MARALTFIFLIVSSCSIIEDSDITSKKEFDDLVISSIDIIQETSLGKTSITGTVTSDEEVNIVVPNGVIKRIVWMDWPSFGNKKLKLRSGYTAAIKTYTSYLSNGLPYTFTIYSKDTTMIVELYRFRYDETGKLDRIGAMAPFIEGQENNTVDRMIYDAKGELTSIERTSPDGTKPEGAIAIQEGAINSLQNFNFGNISVQKVIGADEEYYKANNNSFSNDGKIQLFELEDELTLIDRNNVNDDCQCSKWVDTFYFHPLMLVKDDVVQKNYKQMGIDFELGSALLKLYMVDWWEATSNIETQKDEKVSFKFKYAP